MNKTLINFHIDEVPQVGKISTQSQTLLDRLHQSLGPSASATFSRLDQSLEDLKALLQQCSNDLVEKKRKISDNLSQGSSSVIRVPNPSLPNLNEINTNISNTLSTINSADVQNLHAAASLGSQVRNPYATTLFERRKMEQILAQLSKRISTIQKAYSDVNSFQNRVKSSI